jgi:hypothetical protein
MPYGFEKSKFHFVEKALCLKELLAEFETACKERVLAECDKISR